MTSKTRERLTPDLFIATPCDTDAMLKVGKDQAAVLPALEIFEATFSRRDEARRREAAQGTLRTANPQLK